MEFMLEIFVVFTLKSGEIIRATSWLCIHDSFPIELLKWAYCPGVIINSDSFHFQKCSGVVVN